MKCWCYSFPCPNSGGNYSSSSLATSCSTGESLHCARTARYFQTRSSLKYPQAHPFQMPLNLGHPNYPRQMQATFPSHKTSCKMRKATHISSFLFNRQLSTTLECSGVALFESSLTLPASTKASHVSTSSSTGPGGKVACKRESTSTSSFHLWYNHASSSAAMHPRRGHSTMVRQKPGSPSPQLAHTKVLESMVQMSKKV